MNRPHRHNCVWNILGMGILLCSLSVLAAACGGPGPDGTPTPAPASPTPAPASSTPELRSTNPPKQLFSLSWVAYTPTNYNPDQPIEPSEESLRQDLQTLRDAGFDGLVTYSASGVLGRVVPRLADELGFQGMIMGIWDPNSKDERDQVITAAKTYHVVVGFVVGNEGLGQRYDLPTLQSAVDMLRQTTGKPVTTTEESGDYSNAQLLDLGDWVFPNAHPYYAGYTEPAGAVDWIRQTFDDLRARTKRPVMFKEVGLPTGGDSQGRLSERAQAEYYQRLRQTDVKFVYFEAFDQPWKKTVSVEPFWGLFTADRKPKEAALHLRDAGSAALNPSSTSIAAAELTPTILTSPTSVSTIAAPSSAITPEPTKAAAPTSGLAPAPILPSQQLPPASSGQVYDVYTDAAAPNRDFTPSGKMGDTGDISVNEAWTENPHSGTTSIRITYTTAGKGPNSCPYTPPCKWAGVYWQHPPDNWGTIPNAGIDLRAYRKLTFWARSETEARIEFKVGGLTGTYPDSLQPARSSGVKTLSLEWQKFEIDLSDVQNQLHYVIGGFLWVTGWDNNEVSVGEPKTLVFYLDDIRFEP